MRENSLSPTLSAGQLPLGSCSPRPLGRAEAGRREKFGFAFEATREISDQLWGSPTLAKSRIWGFMAHMWKISAQANAFSRWREEEKMNYNAEII